MKKFSLPKDGGLIEQNLPNGIKHTFEKILQVTLLIHMAHIVYVPKLS